MQPPEPMPAEPSTPRGKRVRDETEQTVSPKQAKTDAHYLDMILLSDALEDDPEGVKRALNGAEVHGINILVKDNGPTGWAQKKTAQEINSRN